MAWLSRKFRLTKPHPWQHLAAGARDEALHTGGMPMLKLTAAFTAIALLAGSPAFADTMTMGGVKATADGWNDAKDMPLYTFARDTVPGKSACNGPCAAAWPPLMATADDKDMGDWTVITRDDGTRQWAYKGQPLYTYAKDTAGQPATGVSPAWPRAKP